MPELSVGLADAEAQRQLPIQLCVRKKQIAAAVQPVHDHLIRLVPSFVAEANQVQRDWSSELEVLIVTDPLREFLCQLHVLPNVMLQSFDSIVADHEPQLQRAEAPP